MVETIEMVGTVETVETITLMVLPEIAVVETVYDEMMANRARLSTALTDGKVKQAFGAWEQNDSMCFLTLAARA